MPATVTAYKSMYAVSLKCSSVKLNAVQLCQLLCDTLQQVGQLLHQHQLNEDLQQTVSQDATSLRNWSSSFYSSDLVIECSIGVLTERMQFSTNLVLAPWGHGAASPFIRQHLSYNECLQDKRENYQNCPVLYYRVGQKIGLILKVCNSHTSSCETTYGQKRQRHAHRQLPVKFCLIFSCYCCSTVFVVKSQLSDWQTRCLWNVTRLWLELSLCECVTMCTSLIYKVKHVQLFIQCVPLHILSFKFACA